ncbi:sulfurtransferase complex subunit TusD [Pseudoalteromonas sp. S2755]|uniref:sulfurtransferase complex subunit TusD n=1 Tax=Pseudoalteromonas sp. S2755 TaxID=2066523 RepID=UPI00110AC963|nr:sulfurtransferase complex subunit TusD [Pseudoalteromonas sp. S2755]TMN33251.1 sulfurtransferase complex subunit TusD [Pseudoalteromonas sp. S2755]
MSQIAISVHFGVAAQSKLTLLERYVDAAIKSDHQVACIFLYQDGVYHASQNIVHASDELQINALWQRIKDKGIPLLLCVTAAEKRGVSIEDVSPFTVAGLAEFAMISSKSDKWIQFK